MNGIDIVILAVLGVSTLMGLWRGLIRELLSLLVWIGALVVARIYAHEVSDMLESAAASLSLSELPPLNNEGLRYILAFVLVFLVAMMLGALIAQAIGSLMSQSGMRPMNRLLGGMFGVLRGTVLVVAALFLGWTLFEDTPQWQASRLIPYGQDIIEYSRQMLARWPDATGQIAERL